MFDESSFRKMMEIMNRHVPPKRRSLAQLLREEEPSYRGRDGNEYRISGKELDCLASLLDPYEQQKLKLPIIIMTDTSYGEGGAWKVMGKLETKVISLVVGKRAEFEEEMRLFHPHMSIIRDKIPTATTCMFMP